jgi:hypothetical protein
MVLQKNMSIPKFEKTLNEKQRYTEITDERNELFWEYDENTWRWMEKRNIEAELREILADRPGNSRKKVP